MLRFKSEKERTNHPQVGRIPKAVWDVTWLSEEVSPREFRLLAEDSPLALRDCLEEGSDALSEREKQRLWICCALRTPKGMDFVLLDIADKINLPSQALFFCASLMGRGELFNDIAKRAAIPLADLIQSNEYAAFHGAARGGDLSLMRRMVAASGTDLLNIIQAKNYAVFWAATHSGHPDVVDMLIKGAGANLLTMIAAHDYVAFKLAAEGGHQHVVEMLIRASGAHLDRMVSARNYGAFQAAAHMGHLDVVNRLLAFPSVLSYAEEHEREYGVRYVHSFVTEKLNTLRALVIGHSGPGLPSLLPEEIPSYFYVMRNLIRRQDPGLSGDIQFLLSIQSIRGYAHFNDNELIRLALNVRNATASGLLFDIPAVRELAANNDYYSREVQGQVDLRALAQNRESSMRALSEAEEKRLEKLTHHYQSTIEAVGVDYLFGALKEQLMERYLANPIRLMIQGEIITLPLDWKSFSACSLTSAARQEALVAYYKHTDHTALRYLSRPNNWLSPQADYVEATGFNRSERGAIFEGYILLMVTLWSASVDETIPPIDGHTLQGRVDHFINELAQIGRAHNWDKTRTAIDRHGNETTEEYDDLEGDKPSCYSGVKRRLFQSVVGHPLFTRLTPELIKTEWRDAMRSHFKCAINQGNRANLLKAWNDYLASGELRDAEPLRALNVSPLQQNAFIQSMVIKYGDDFSSEPSFTKSIQDRFRLIENETRPSDCLHALKFDGEVNLMAILKEQPHATRQPGLFSGPRSAEPRARSAGHVAHAPLHRPTKSIWR